MAAFLRRDGSDLLVAIRLTPRASRDAIGALWQDAQGQGWLQASVTAPPDKGRANAALIALLAKRFKVAQSSILLETGEVSRLKRLRILDCPAALEQQLASCRDIDRKNEEQS
jgi:uncharacterized protein